MPQGNKSFDQAGVSTAEMKATRAKYDAAVKALLGVAPDHKDYEALRKTKLEAAKAMHDARSAAEQAYYADTIAEVKADAEEIKRKNEERGKIAPA
jgi:hypothetical protein